MTRTRSLRLFGPLNRVVRPSTLRLGSARPTILRSAALIAAAFVIAASPAHASFIATIEQVGNEVVVTGSGSLNLAALTQGGTIGGAGPILITSGVPPHLFFGAGVSGGAIFYSGITGPSSYGAGPWQNPTSATGNGVGLGDGIFVPLDYTSGSPISASMTFANATIDGLGITPGTYTWTWGTGNTADSFVITTGTTIPEPTSLLLAGSAMAGWIARRKRTAS